MAKIKAVELIEIIESLVGNRKIDDGAFREMVTRLIKDVDKTPTTVYYNDKC